MDPADRATLVKGRGFDTGVKQGGVRQVTVFSRDVWDEVTRGLPGPPEPSARRGNLYVSGVDLTNSRGRVLRIATTRIRIVGETRPCERMDEACPGLKAALERPWAGGAFGEVLDDGEIAVGDPVELEREPG
jgi:MOSC domain-containing protein YiiM